ncbi:MAG: hypothetical protein WCP52_03605 [Bacteroidota bacterium]
MKKTLLLFVAFFVSQFLFSQDTILKYSGESIVAKVLEIGPLEIKYKKFDFQDGPTYIIKKDDVDWIRYAGGLKEHFERQSQPKSSTQNSTDYYGAPATNNRYAPDNKITEFGSRYRYNNGLITEREMQSMLMNTKDKRIMGLIETSKQAHGLQFVGFAAIPLGIGALAFISESSTTTYNAQTYTYNKNPNQQTYQMLAFICGMVAIACPIYSGISKHKRIQSNREAINLYNQKY